MPLIISPDDEHVSFYGRPILQPSKSTAATSTASAAGCPMLLKTWSGSFAYQHHHLPNNNNNNNNDDDDDDQVMPPYPRLPVSKLLQALDHHRSTWSIESIRIAHVQLLGTRAEFGRFASYLAHCTTLKTVLLSDAKTSLLVISSSSDDDGDEVESSWSGLDDIVRALSQAPHLQELSMQDITVSSQALAAIGSAPSLIKLQLLLSQSLLASTGGCITGEYLQPLTRQLSLSSNLEELRIFGVVDDFACVCLSELLQENTRLQKLSLKIKLPSCSKNTRTTRGATSFDTSTSTNNSRHLPLLAALQSPICSLVHLELYLTGTRPDVELYAHEFCKALQTNQTLQHLNIILYGLFESNTTTTTSTRRPSAFATSAMMASLDHYTTNQVWMTQLANLLQQGSNMVLQHILLNHGLIELNDTIKFLLRLNRVGRRFLFSQPHHRHHHHQSNVCYLSANNNSVVSTAPCTTTCNTTSSSGVELTTNDFTNDNKSDAVAVTNAHDTEQEVSTEVERWIETLDRVRNDLSCIYYLLSCNPTILCQEPVRVSNQFGRMTLPHDDTDSGDGTGAAAVSLPVKRKRWVASTCTTQK